MTIFKVVLFGVLPSLGACACVCGAYYLVYGDTMKSMVTGLREGAEVPNKPGEYLMDIESVVLQVILFRRMLAVVMCGLAALLVICATIIEVH